MHSGTKPVLGLLTLGLLMLMGCQKPLHYEKSFTLTPGETQAFPVDAPKSQQQVTVAVTANGSPVNVFIVLESEHAATMDALANKGKNPDAAKVLASKEKMESGALEATVPAQKGFSVFVTGAKKNADVTLKITGK